MSTCVKAIIEDVVARGDAALRGLYAPVRPAGPRRAADLAIYAGGDRRRPGALRCRRASRRCGSRMIASRPITRARSPADERFTDALGVELGHRWTAVEAAGLYVPGGTASYPSSVLMNAVPAKVAGRAAHRHGGPSPDGVLNPLVLAAARIAGVTESTASAAHRRSPRSPTARPPSRRSPRSSGPATPMWRPPSAASSGRSAST